MEMRAGSTLSDDNVASILRPTNDIIASILRHGQPSDWARYHTVCELWNRLADRLDVVRAVFLSSGGHPAEDLDAAGYRARILSSLRFSSFLNNSNPAKPVIGEAFDMSGIDTFALQERLLPKSLLLRSAGLPHCFITSEYGTTLVWNTQSGEAYELDNDFSDAVAYCINGEPRMARVWVGWTNGVHVIINDPVSGSEIKRQIFADDFIGRYRHPCYQAELQYVRDVDALPRLLLYTYVIGKSKDSLHFLDAETLEVTGRCTFDYAKPWPWGCLAVWNDQPVFLFEGDVCRLDLETGTLGEVIASRVTRIHAVQAGNHSYLLMCRNEQFIYSGEEPLEILGYGIIQVPENFAFHSYTTNGGRWGDHDYLIFWPKRRLCDKGVIIWRDDNVVTTLKVDIPIPIRGPQGEHRKWLSEYRKSLAITPLPSGFALNAYGHQPTIIRMPVSAPSTIDTL